MSSFSLIELLLQINVFFKECMDISFFKEYGSNALKLSKNSHLFEPINNTEIKWYYLHFIVKNSGP